MIRRLFLVLIVSLLLAGHSPAEPSAPSKLRVLFIGNSLTYVNDLPAALASMASATGRELDHDGVLVGGASLEKHWAEGKAAAKIQEGKWDYVVLQGHSSEAIKNREALFRHGHLFDAEIKKAGAKTALYMTWNLENDTKSYPLISGAYTDLAKELGALLVPAGTAWHMASENTATPAPLLYSPDHKHPAPAGTYLAACVFYRVLFQAPSAGLPAKLEGSKKSPILLSAEEAATLQKIADSVPLEKTQ